MAKKKNVCHSDHLSKLLKWESQKYTSYHHARTAQLKNKTLAQSEEKNLNDSYASIWWLNITHWCCQLIFNEIFIFSSHDYYKDSWKNMLNLHLNPYHLNNIWKTCFPAFPKALHELNFIIWWTYFPTGTNNSCAPILLCLEKANNHPNHQTQKLVCLHYTL